MRPKKTLYPKAMTLMEVVVTTFILGIGALALVQGLYLSKKTSDDVQKKLAIFNLARGYLDQMRAMKTSQLEASTFTVMHPDGSTLNFTENQWNTVPASLLQRQIPKSSLQVNPQVSLQTTTEGKWYTITLNYRYNITKNTNLPVASWPTSLLQAIVADLRQDSNIVFQTNQLALENRQRPFVWPPIVKSYHPKFWINTIPKPPIPPPIPWQDTPPAYEYIPGAPLPPPPIPQENNNTSL